MSRYQYVAVNQQGKTSSGSFEAVDRSAALSILAKQQLRPIKLKQSDNKEALFSLGDFFGKNKVKSDDLVIFTRQLSAMVSAGVPLLRAIASLNQHTTSKPLKK